MWRLLGVDARLRRAGPSFGPPATLITLLGLSLRPIRGLLGVQIELVTAALK